MAEWSTLLRDAHTVHSPKSTRVPAKTAFVGAYRSQVGGRKADGSPRIPATPGSPKYNCFSPGGTEFVTWLPADPAVDLRNPLEA
jgi:hypothetical protein